MVRPLAGTVCARAEALEFGLASLAIPKSSTYRLPAARQVQIGRLDVAMDEAGGMRGVERVSYLPGNLDNVIER